MQAKNYIKEKLRRVAESGDADNSQLINSEQCKFLVGLIDALEEIQSLPSVREDESSQIAFIALKGKR